MSSRDEILGKVRQRLPVATPLPDLTRPWTEYPDPEARFREVLESVGGRCSRVPDRRTLNQQLEAIPEYAAAGRRINLIAGLTERVTDLDTIADPHDLQDVDFAVLPGEIAVAENGAVWVATDSVPARTLYFLTQRLALVVPADAMVSNLHQAYERIDPAARRFGTFISGPSKTADIEQSLVIGAHGSRSLHVFLLESA